MSIGKVEARARISNRVMVTRGYRYEGDAVGGPGGRVEGGVGRDGKLLNLGG